MTTVIIIKYEYFVPFCYNVNFILIRVYNHSVRITTYVVLPPLLLCVLILYMSGGTYGLKSTSNDTRIFEFSMLFYLLWKSDEKKLPEKYFLILRVVGLVWPRIWSNVSRLDSGDFSPINCPFLQTSIHFPIIPHIQFLNIGLIFVFKTLEIKALLQVQGLYLIKFSYFFTIYLAIW